MAVRIIVTGLIRATSRGSRWFMRFPQRICILEKNSESMSCSNLEICHHQETVFSNHATEKKGWRWFSAVTWSAVSSSCVLGSDDPDQNIVT
jgi:hypothetical protein